MFTGQLLISSSQRRSPHPLSIVRSGLGKFRPVRAQFLQSFDGIERCVIASQFGRIVGSAKLEVSPCAMATREKIEVLWRVRLSCHQLVKQLQRAIEMNR